MPSDAVKSLESPGVRGDGVHPVIIGVYAFYLTKTMTKMFWVPSPPPSFFFSS